MTTTTAQASIKCSCGNDKFEMPKNPKPSDIIKCARCGASGRHDQIMRQASQQIKNAVEKRLIDAFRKAGFK